jgi:putative phosphoesterase
MIRIGLISDTHGLLRPEAFEALRGSDFIVHAGDIGEDARERPAVPERAGRAVNSLLERLETLAPVTAVRGNNDRGPWAERLAGTAWLHAGGIVVHVLHDLADLDLDPDAAGVDVVVAGHSHRPKIQRRGGLLFVNPGSAGPVRFKLPVSIALLQVRGREVDARIVELESRRGQEP